MMTTGTLTAELDDAELLRNDVFGILMQFRSGYGAPAISPDLSDDELRAYADRFASALHQVIGGHYIQKPNSSPAARAARYAAIYEMWNGKNRDQVMRHFGISRRWFYSVIAHETKRRQRVAVIENTNGGAHGSK
jgi:hypothetical protein